MEQQIVDRSTIELVGFSLRTNNRDEMDPTRSKIGPTVAHYIEQQQAQAFASRVNPGVTYAVYTNYESDEHGDYTYFLGEETSEAAQAGFASLLIPTSRYVKFTTEAGNKYEVLMAAWSAIWQMTEEDFGGKRSYIADFEVYDHRAQDPEQTVIDIYIGLVG